MAVKFCYKNRLAAPRLLKVVLNVGLGQGLKDKEYCETAKATLARISGQKPVETKSRKSISNFKIRQGMVIGVKVTLRGAKMWDFVEKLVKITLPRVRDFQGLSLKGFDGQGNFSIGFKEYLAFPEVSSDEIERQHGLEITISTSAKNRKEGEELLQLLGFPFKKEEK